MGASLTEASLTEASLTEASLCSLESSGLPNKSKS
ncbi:hypothetical protein ACLD5S_05565 [Gardnerella vaginalis]